jgi:hypothetical protein
MRILLLTFGKLIFKIEKIDGIKYLRPYDSEFNHKLFRNYIRLLPILKKKRKDSILNLSDFKKVLKEIIDRFHDKNPDFLLNISNTTRPEKKDRFTEIDKIERILIDKRARDDVNGDVQIVHPVRLYRLDKDKNFLKFGFVVHISFDNSLKIFQDKNEIFKKLEIYSRFKNYDWNGVQCYYCNCGLNIDLIYDTTTSILKNLYNYKDDTKTHFDIEINESIKNGA